MPAQPLRPRQWQKKRLQAQLRLSLAAMSWQALAHTRIWFVRRQHGWSERSDSAG